MDAYTDYAVIISKQQYIYFFQDAAFYCNSEKNRNIDILMHYSFKQKWLAHVFGICYVTAHFIEDKTQIQMFKENTWAELHNQME